MKLLNRLVITKLRRINLNYKLNLISIRMSSREKEETIESKLRTHINIEIDKRINKQTKLF